jgi:hypothetical protein
MGRMLRRLAKNAWAPVVVMMISAGQSACTDDSDNKSEIVGDIRQSQTWKDGDKLAGVIRIFEGATIEIEPGARITCVEAVQIQVGGTLRVKSAGKRAKITCPRWGGILVATHGQVDLEGIDLENPDIGVETTKGAGAVSVTDSSITSSARPFRVGAGTKLTVTNVVATTPTTLQELDVSVSEVFGTFVAKRLDYEANTNEGIMAMKGGEVDIEDSTLKAKNGFDLVSSYGGKSVKVRYTTMRGGHCGAHIDQSKDAEKTPTGSVEIDHVTSENNTFGITIYAASTEGPHIVKDSNFQGASAWLDLQGLHGPITFQNVFTDGTENIQNTDPPTITKASARVDDAKPR